MIWVCRHSKLDLEPSGRLDALTSLMQSILPCGMDANASVDRWIPNQVWNDGKGALA
jgi:hypothetical protein